MTEKQNPQEQLAGIVDKLGQYVEYHREEGATSLEVDPKLVASLGQDATTPPPEPEQVQTAQPATQSPPAGGDGDLAEIAERISKCTRYRLHETRTNTVPGQGPPHPEIVFIGEGPGADEDRQGIPFVGRAGKLLTKIIEAMGLTRDEVFIGNIVKCRPPQNRAPLPDETEACMPYLKQQLALLKPKVIICLGASAVKGLLDVQTGITRLRGTWMSFEGIDVMPTFHPAYLLRNSAGKKPVWEDMQAVLERLGRKPPKQQDK